MRRRGTTSRRPHRHRARVAGLGARPGRPGGRPMARELARVGEPAMDARGDDAAAGICHELKAGVCPPNGCCGTHVMANKLQRLVRLIVAEGCVVIGGVASARRMRKGGTPWGGSRTVGTT